MKDQFLQIRTNSELKKNKKIRGSVPYEKATSVGVLFSFEGPSKHDVVKEFIKLLETDGKKVKVLGFLPKQEENHESLFDFFSIKDISFWGKINSADAVKFSEIPFDYLFCTDTESNPFVLHLIAKSKAKCRIGKFAEHDQSYFELMIEQNGTTRGLVENMYKYTKQLK